MSRPREQTGLVVEVRVSLGGVGAVAYGAYEESLRAIIAGSEPWSAAVSASFVRALGDEPSAALRRSVNLGDRRSLGAFWTGSALRTEVRELLASIGKPPYTDPACGAGDLLLAAAENLPVLADLQATLDLWSTQLLGSDLEPEFVGVARARLAMLARLRQADETVPAPASTQFGLPAVLNSDGHLTEALFPGLRPLNGVLEAKKSGLDGTVLLNPPFGSMNADVDCSWGSGSISRAAWFADEIIQSMRPNAKIVAILPDVLRSGSRYARWRQHIGARLSLDLVSPVGRFDRHADVDVFLMVGSRRARESEGPPPPSGWPGPAEWRGGTVGDQFSVRVGAVVPHRHKEEGTLFGFLQARDLGKRATITNVDRRRRFNGTVFEPPFVVLRRTDRPSDSVARAQGVVVDGKDAIAVENHLLVLTPLDGRLDTCRGLQSLLASRRVNDWLDQRIRCRHLTVSAVREIPWFEPDPESFVAKEFAEESEPSVAA